MPRGFTETVTVHICPQSLTTHISRKKSAVLELPQEESDKEAA